MGPVSFLTDLVLVFAVAGVVVFLFQHWRVPALVGLLVAGVLVGPNGLGLIEDEERVRLLAEVGVIVLLFAVGLEFSLSRLLGMWQLMLWVGLPQVLATGMVIAPLTGELPESWGRAIFAGILVAMSSTAVVLKVLAERQELAAPQGKIAIAVLLFQDLLVVVFMLLVPVMAGREAEGPPLWQALGLGIGVVGAVLTAARYVIPPLVYRVARTRNRELFLIFLTVLCLGTAGLTAAVGLSLALGAFLAGLALSESEFAHQALAEVLPVRDILASLFFISVGMLLDLNFAASHWLLVIGTALGVLLLKFVTAAVPTWWAGYPPRVALLVGLALAQVGEFSFVLAERGLEVGLLGPADYQAFLATAVITITLTPLLIAGGPRLAERLAAPKSLFAWLAERPIEAIPEGLSLRNHVIIAGYGVNGRNLARVLRDVDIAYIVLEMNPETVRQARKQDEPVYFGDCTRQAVLEHFRILDARLLVVAISDPPATRRVVQIARQLAPTLHIIVRTRYVAEVDELRRLGANEIIPEEFETSVEIFARVLREYEVPRNLVLDLIDRIRGDHYEVLRKFHVPATRLELPFDILSKVEVESCQIGDGTPAVGKSLADLQVRSATGATIIAVRRHEELLLNPDAHFCFQKGDIAVLIGDRPQVDRALLLLDPGLAGK
jgi:CPA2 family monovalent cation:H+ antiporter-2